MTRKQALRWAKEHQRRKLLALIPRHTVSVYPNFSLSEVPPFLDLNRQWGANPDWRK